MSLSAKSQPLAVRRSVHIESLTIGLKEWGYAFVGGQLFDVAQDLEVPSYVDHRKLHPYEINQILSGELDSSQVQVLIEGKSAGAKYVARRLLQNSWREKQHQSSLDSIKSDWAALKELRRWMDVQDADYLKKMDLDSPGKLLYLGIRFSWQADRFCALYSQVCNVKRPWGSCDWSWN
jgi:hypothetical protein